MNEVWETILRELLKYSTNDETGNWRKAKDALHARKARRAGSLMLNLPEPVDPFEKLVDELVEARDDYVAKKPSYGAAVGRFTAARDAAERALSRK